MTAEITGFLGYVARKRRTLRSHGWWQFDLHVSVHALRRARREGRSPATLL
jgi:hypothetical protein